MHRVLKLSLLSILVIAAVFLVAACGGGSTSTTATSASTSSTQAPDTTVSTDATETTAASDSTDTSAGAAGQAGSKADPVPLKTRAAIGDWKVQVTKADLNAAAAVKSAPGYQAPEAGSQYVLVEIKADYTADIPDSFSNGLGCQIVGSGGDTFSAVELGLDNSIANTDALTNGDSVSGPLVFVVPSAQLDGALLSVAPGSAAEQSEVYFALQ